MTTILDVQALRQRLAPYIRPDGPSSGSFPAVFSQVELLALLDRAEAAPKLLEALKGLIANPLPEKKGDSLVWTQKYKAHANACDVAHDAIAKAEGR